MIKLEKLIETQIGKLGRESKHRNFSGHAKLGQLSEAFDFLKLVHNWSDIVGPRLSKHTIPLKNQGRNLTLLTDHSAISQQVDFISSLIINKIEEEFPQLKGKIQKLNFIVDSTHFQKKMEQVSNQKSILAKQGKLKKSELQNVPKDWKERTGLHPYSPEFQKLKKQADSFFENVEDKQVKDLLTSLYIQISHK